MKTWQYSFIVLLGGCCYGALSTFVNLAYATGFTVEVVTGSQYFLGTLLIGQLHFIRKKETDTW